MLPGVIALIAENTGHVKAVAEMTGEDLDPYMGRAIGADGVATAFASAFGGSPTTTYAENIGVMGATRVYSTAAYYFAAGVAILLGLCPVRPGRQRDPGWGPRWDHDRPLRDDRSRGREDLGGERRRLGNPVNLVGPPRPVFIAGIGGVTLQVTDDFGLGRHRPRHDPS